MVMYDMKSLISVNYKFMEINPKRLVELICDTKYVKGIEIYVDNSNTNELKYLDDLVFEIKKNNLILQIHGDSTLSLVDQIKFIKKLEEYSKYLGYPIVLTLHSIYDYDTNESINKTITYLQDVVNNIDNNKVIISLENLNDIPNYDRLEKEYITPIILNDEKVYFTYDIGHEIINYGKIIDLNKYLIEEIKNIHLHTMNNGIDHMPIYKNDQYWNLIVKALTYLINNKYSGGIVYEYDLNRCYGNTIEEKIIDYLNSIDFVSEHYS